MKKKLTAEQRAISICYEHKVHPDNHFPNICCVVCEPVAQEIKKAVQTALQREKYYEVNGRPY